MSTIHKFEDIEAWKLARLLCRKISIMVKEGKFANNYRLIGQLQGSSGSIMDNIAEGFERGTKNEFILFLGYAKGSCGEVRSQLFRALDCNYINQTEFDEGYLLTIRISTALQKFLAYLLKSSIQGPRKKVS